MIISNIFHANLFLDWFENKCFDYAIIFFFIPQGSYINLSWILIITLLECAINKNIQFSLKNSSRLLWNRESIQNENKILLKLFSYKKCVNISSFSSILSNNTKTYSNCNWNLSYSLFLNLIFFKLKYSLKKYLCSYKVKIIDKELLLISFSQITFQFKIRWIMLSSITHILEIFI